MTFIVTTWSRRRPGARLGFTLVELLVVIGILSVLMGILIPTVAASRRHARVAQCASNLRQIATALVMYANASGGYFPPNVGALHEFWYTDALTGQYIGSGEVLPDGARARGVLLCPDDVERALRSYSMNTFASSAVSPFVLDSIAKPPVRGQLFKMGVAESSRLVLLTESFTKDVSPEPPLTQLGFASPAIIGWGPLHPGQRFGTGVSTKRYFQINYSRHRAGGQNGSEETPVGRANIAFVDGHVELLRHDDLADWSSGKSTYRAMWSPIDREID